MEIQWGDWYIKIEKTVAMILALIPIVALMYIPKVSGAIDRLKGRLAAKYPGHYGNHPDIEDKNAL